MTVKTSKVSVENNVENDIGEELDEVVKDEPIESVNDDKMAELMAKMKAKKEEKEDMPPKIVEEKVRSIEFGVLGSGQAGSRIAECFYRLGYPSVAMNTAQQDLKNIEIPDSNKLLLEYGIGGAAKDLDIGAAAASSNRDAINNIVDDKLNDSHIYLFCTSLGGGSGAGSAEVVVDLLAASGKPVIVCTVLPMSTDDAQTKDNALQTLSKFAKMAQNKEIANLIVVDNAKIEAIYSDVGQMDFFRVGNEAIVNPIDVFNRFSAQDSKVKALDSMEVAKIFSDGEGLTTYGEIVVEDYTDETAIAEGVIENLNDGLLAGGFDLSQTKYAGMMVIGHPNVWKEIPSGSVNYARALIMETCNTDAVFHGIYEDESMDQNCVKVYSMFSGLGLPNDRVEQLRKEAQADKKKAQEREKNRNLNLKLDTGKDETVTQAEKVRQMVKKKKSKFGSNFAGGFKDFRNK